MSGVAHVSHDGTVYTDEHVLQVDPTMCKHNTVNYCRECDSGGAMATRYGDDCPWTWAVMSDA